MTQNRVGGMLAPGSAQPRGGANEDPAPDAATAGNLLSTVGAGPISRTASTSAVSMLTTATSTPNLHGSVRPSSDAGRPSSTSFRRPSVAWDHEMTLAHAQEFAENRASTPFEAEKFWRSESESSEGEDDGGSGAASMPKRSGTRSGGSSSKFIRSSMKKLGLTYKKYEESINPKEDEDRNTVQNDIILELFEGRHHLAPLTRAKRVLDVGTGSGVWALEYAQKNPGTAVLGVDIEPVNAPFSLSNCRFIGMDVTGDWEFESPFDFVHVRMLGDIPGKRQLIRSIYDHLSPGGWVEFTEWVVRLQSPNNTFQGTALYRWNRLLHEGLRKAGSSLHYATRYRPLLEQAGFESVTETRNAAPTNACYPGKRLQRVGNMMTRHWLAIIEPLTVPVFVGALGWTPAQTMALIAEVRSEIVDPKIRSYMTLLTVFARKPKERLSVASGSEPVSASASSSSLPVASQGTTAAQPS